MSKKIKILLDTPDYMVIDKPAGIVVHPADCAQTKESVVDFLKENFPQLKDVGEPWKTDKGEFSRYGIAHRLDKETSGALIIAKKENIFKYFKKLFKKRRIKKHYKAFVYGVLKDDAILIDKPLGRDPKDFRKKSAKPNARGELKDAQTLIHLIDTVGKGNEGFSFLDVYPKTGRTHQIRAHLDYIQKPIVCDKLYAPARDCALGFDRLALHCFSLEFTDPISKNQIKVESPLPEDFVKAVAIFNSKNIS